MSTLNINDLYDSINNKNFKRMKKFDDILVQIHRRIKYHADLEQTFCLYSIPEFIFGTPLYNINDLKKYIMDTLKKNGFKLMYFHPNTIFISWDVENKIKNPSHLLSLKSALNVDKIIKTKKIMQIKFIVFQLVKVKKTPADKLAVA